MLDILQIPGNTCNFGAVASYDLDKVYYRSLIDINRDDFDIAIFERSVRYVLKCFYDVFRGVILYKVVKTILYRSYIRKPDITDSIQTSESLGSEKKAIHKPGMHFSFAQVDINFPR